MTIRPTQLFIVPALIVLLAGCSGNPDKTPAAVQSSDTVKQSDRDTVKQVIATDPVPATGPAKILFDKNKPFEIISSERDITTSSSAPDTSQCKGWTIAQKDLPKIIKGCRSISGSEWHYLFDVLPCIIKGELKQNGQVCQFEINAGSWMSIRCADTALQLGNFNKQNEKYFISKAWDTKTKPE